MNKADRNILLAIFSTILALIIIMLVTVGQYFMGIFGIIVIVAIIIKVLLEKE